MKKSFKWRSEIQDFGGQAIDNKYCRQESINPKGLRQTRLSKKGKTHLHNMPMFLFCYHLVEMYVDKKDDEICYGTLKIA